MGCLPLCGLAPVWILLRFESRHGVVRVRIRCNDDVIEWRINNMHVYIHVMWWYLFEGSGGSSYLDDGEERDTGCGGAGDAPTKCVCPRWILVTIILERTVLSKTENHDKLKKREANSKLSILIYFKEVQGYQNEKRPDIFPANFPIRTNSRSQHRSNILRKSASNISVNYSRLKKFATFD